MNKICTSIKQSKKLAKILPIESADMWYHGHGSPWESEREYDSDACPFHSMRPNWDIPCWSLAALLNVLPDSIYDNTYEFSQLEFTKKSVAYIHGTTDGIKIGALKDNLVDACYEMILKLHEQKLL